MVIAHNMAAMNAQRQVNIVTDKKQKSTEKLSSGYRINRAADDAAGLSISEKMRKQIRGLNRSAKNIEDGISLVQVADGALAEDSDILQRMNVLAVQAANGTNSASDRADIQKEIDQLTSEIDRIAETTKFNEVFPLCPSNNSDKHIISSIRLENQKVAKTIEKTIQVPVEKERTIENVGLGTYHFEFPNELEIVERTVEVDPSFNPNGLIYINNKRVLPGESATLKLLNSSKYGSYNFYDKSGDPFISALDGNPYDGIVGPIKITDNTPFTLHVINANYFDMSLDDITMEDDGRLSFQTTKGKKLYLGYGVQNDVPYEFIAMDEKYYLKQQSSLYQNIFMYGDQVEDKGSKTIKETVLEDQTITTTEYVNELVPVDYSQVIGKHHLWLQTGPDTLSGFSLELCDATTNSLGIHDPPIDVSTYDNCMDALNRVGDAITKVSSFRSIFGAQQNRLESAYRNNTNTAENTQAAESRIRDTDMADEVVNNAKQDILLQAGQAMISQANQQNQGVLSLLQ